jgi:hypothetical protein
LGNELGPHLMNAVQHQGRAEAVAARRRHLKRPLVGRERLQAMPQPFGLGRVDAGAGAAGIDQPAVGIVASQCERQTIASGASGWRLQVPDLVDRCGAGRRRLGKMVVEELSVLVMLMKVLRRQDGRYDRHLGVELDAHQSLDDGVGNELVPVDAAIDDEPRGNDRGAVRASDASTPQKLPRLAKDRSCRGRRRRPRTASGCARSPTASWCRKSDRNRTGSAIRCRLRARRSCIRPGAALERVDK